MNLSKKGGKKLSRKYVGKCKKIWFLLNLLKVILILYGIWLNKDINTNKQSCIAC